MPDYRALCVYNNEQGYHARIINRQTEPLTAGELLIEVHYSSLNYKDALAVTGKGKIIRNFPLVAGIDAAGYVVESKDPRFKTGAAVLVTGYQLSQTHDGGYTEYAKMPADWVVPLPEGLSLYEAMTLGTAGFTAGLAIARMEHNGQQPDAGPILISGASGGVGSVAISCFAALGYDVVALSGKASASAQYLRMLGASEVLDRHQLAIDARPLEKALWGGALDTVGGDVLAWLTRTVKPHGNIASCGLAGGAELNTTVMPFILRGVNLLGVDSAATEMSLRAQVWQRLAGDLKPACLDKMVAGVISLEHIPEYAEKLLAGQVQGRYVVEIK